MKPEKKTDKKSAAPKRVELIDKRGNIARPFEKDVAAWLAKGWQRKAGNAE